MAPILLSIFAVVAAVSGAVGGFALVHRRVEAATRREFNQVGGLLYAVVGVAYSVLLTFVTTVVWQQYSAAGANVDHEASALLTLYHLAATEPQPKRDAMTAAIRAYMTNVVDDEWTRLADGRASTRATAIVDELRGAIFAAPAPLDAAQQVRYAESQRQFDGFADYRRQRLYASRDNLPTPFWAILGGGAAVTVAFAYFFGMENARVHGLMIGLLALTLASMLVFIKMLDNPFVGPTRVPTTAFEQALASIK